MMRLIRTRWFIVSVLLLFVAAPGAWLLARDAGGGDTSLVSTVMRGPFKVTVTTAGELRALKDVKIQGPLNAQVAQVYQFKISSLVPEGTLVKEGDVVAQLDLAPAQTKFTEVSLALQKAQAQYEQAELDSTLNLSKAREDMKTMEIGLEEKQIAKDQAKYEAPSVQRQAEIDLEKAQRALEQAKKDYVTKTEQAKAKMREVGADYQRQKNILAAVQSVMQDFTIKAPAPGMVIYVKEWNGKKRTVGAQINTWDPTVATLPDLTHMESITYINEIDVRKIAVGQPAEISLDADPTKHLTGKVTSVANVGEQRPNTDAKVFEVHVELAQPDTTLRPGMTTGNAIETLALDDVLHIPLEALTTVDGISYAYKRSGARVVKQEVQTGAMSDDEVVITRGLDEGEHVLLSPPANASEVETVRLPGSGDAPPPTAGDTAVKQPVLPDTGARTVAPGAAPAAPKPPGAHQG